MFPCVRMLMIVCLILSRRYLLHPFSIATTLAKSTIIFSNLFVALAIFSATSGEEMTLLYISLLPTNLITRKIRFPPLDSFLSLTRHPSLALPSSPSSAFSSSPRKEKQRIKNDNSEHRYDRIWSASNTCTVPCELVIG